MICQTVFAGLPFSINCRYKFTYRMLSRYSAPVDDVAAFKIELTPADFEKERAFSLEGETCHESQLEYSAIHRKLAEYLPSKGTCVAHGSCIAVDGNGYVFMAKSGTGKSTHTRLWRDMLGGRAIMVNDDKPFLSAEGSTACAWGSPWSGKAFLDTNCVVPLKGICVLERGTENSIQNMEKSELFCELMKYLYRPESHQAQLQTVMIAKRIVAAVPGYRLFCNVSPEAAELSFRTMTAEP